MPKDGARDGGTGQGTGRGTGQRRVGSRRGFGVHLNIEDGSGIMSGRRSPIGEDTASTARAGKQTQRNGSCVSSASNEQCRTAVVASSCLPRRE